MKLARKIPSIDDAPEQRKGERIEGPQPREKIEHQPRRKPDYVQNDEPGAADKTADQVSGSCQCSLAGLKCLFVFGNGLDMFPDVLGQMFQKSLRPFGQLPALRCMESIFFIPPARSV
jgi:hypothetical protein